MENFIDALSEHDKHSIYECLCVAEREEIFPEWEFQTLFGIPRKELADVREKWPKVDISQPNVGMAVIGAVNHLLGYSSDQNMKWEEYISVSPESIRVISKKLLELGL